MQSHRRSVPRPSLAAVCCSISFHFGALQVCSPADLSCTVLIHFRVLLRLSIASLFVTSPGLAIPQQSYPIYAIPFHCTPGPSRLFPLVTTHTRPRLGTADLRNSIPQLCASLPYNASPLLCRCLPCSSPAIRLHTSPYRSVSSQNTAIPLLYVSYLSLSCHANPLQNFSYPCHFGSTRFKAVLLFSPPLPFFAVRFPRHAMPCPAYPWRFDSTLCLCTQGSSEQFQSIAFPSLSWLFLAFPLRFFTIRCNSAANQINSDPVQAPPFRHNSILILAMPPLC